MQKIQSKYNEFVLMPSNAIAPNSFECETMDGIICRIEYQTTWNNSDGEYDAELEEECQKRYGCSFAAIRSIWMGRIGKIDGFWHLVKMIKK